MEGGTMRGRGRGRRRGRGRGQKRPKETAPGDGAEVTGGEKVQVQGDDDDRQEETAQQSAGAPNVKKKENEDSDWIPPAGAPSFEVIYEPLPQRKLRFRTRKQPSLETIPESEEETETHCGIEKETGGETAVDK